jgi:DNA-3-methyladenine glycosylase
MLHKRLKRRFFNRDPSVVAPELIGCGIARRIEGVWVGGMIIETEAYLSTDDPASHSRSGLTRRCQSMFAEPGTLYVYTIHAKYCMNVVTQESGIGSAVLIRAIEPLWGLDQMRVHRGYDDLMRLTRGPAMLCQAMAITTEHDGHDLVSSDEIIVVRLPKKERVICSGPRIGITSGQDMPLRFFEQANPHTSRRPK